MRVFAKHFLVVLLLLVSAASFAKQRKFFGRVINVSGIGLPYAVVESKDRVFRFFADSKGVFNFLAEPDSIDFFDFSAQGYDKTEFLVEDLPDDSIIIELKARENNLKGAVIGAKGNKTNEGIAGIGRGGYNTECYLNINDEIAVYCPATEAKKTFVREVGVFITKGGIAKNEFRVHIYTKDSATGGPGADITDSVLVLHAHRGNEWVTADLTNRFIQVDGGVFISVEWIVGGKKNDFYAWEIPTGNSNYYSGNDSLRQTYNGQVLGLAWQDEKPIVYRKYASNAYMHKNEGKWFLTPPLVGGHKGKRWITPMIYFTYIYPDK